MCSNGPIRDRVDAYLSSAEAELLNYSNEATSQTATFLDHHVQLYIFGSLGLCTSKRLPPKSKLQAKRCSDTITLPCPPVTNLSIGMSTSHGAPSTIQPLEFVLDLNTNPRPQVRVQPVPLADFLLRYPKSPYTTLVTVQGGTAVPFLDFHCTRLLQGFETLYPGGIPPIHAQLRDTLLALLAEVIKSYTCILGELQIAVVLVADRSRLLLCTHAAHVPHPAKDISPIEVDCRGGPRDQPGVKNTSWYIERKPLEAAQPEGVAETILLGLDNDGYRILLEGLVSNMFVVTKTLQVWTAPAHLVLPGSVRACVLSACHQLDISVHETGVRLNDFEQFEAAFLTSARRFLVPVQSIHFSDPGGESNIPREIELPQGPSARHLIDRLRCVVCQHLTKEATLIP